MPEDATSQDDFDEMTAYCPSCGAEVYEDAVSCPTCGDYFDMASTRPPGARWWRRVVGAGLLLLAGAGFLLISVCSVPG